MVHYTIPFRKGDHSYSLHVSQELLPFAIFFISFLDNSLHETLK